LNLDPGIAELVRLAAREAALEAAEARPAPVRWLRPDDAARYCAISRETLERHRRLGTGPREHRLSSKLIRYSLDDLDSWVRQEGGGE
jgi:predicted DNA-binding transcriptional regulator AlpA